MCFNGFTHDATLFGICHIYRLPLGNIWGGVFDEVYSNVSPDLTTLKLEYVGIIEVFWERHA